MIPVDIGSAETSAERGNLDPIDTRIIAGFEKAFFAGFFGR